MITIFVLFWNKEYSYLKVCCLFDFLISWHRLVFSERTAVIIQIPQRKSHLVALTLVTSLLERMMKVSQSMGKRQHVSMRMAHSSAFTAQMSVMIKNHLQHTWLKNQMCEHEHIKLVRYRKVLFAAFMERNFTKGAENVIVVGLWSYWTLMVLLRYNALPTVVFVKIHWDTSDHWLSLTRKEVLVDKQWQEDIVSDLYLAVRNINIFTYMTVLVLQELCPNLYCQESYSACHICCW